MKGPPKITLTLTPEELDLVMRALCTVKCEDEEIVAKYGFLENDQVQEFVRAATDRSKVLPDLLSKVCRAHLGYRCGGDDDDPC